MNLRSWRRCRRAGIASLLIFAVASCGSKVNEANYQRIQDGMSREEVESILGQATEGQSVGFGGFSGGNAVWKADDGTTISIQFVNGKVASKQFFQAEPDQD